VKRCGKSAWRCWRRRRALPVVKAFVDNVRQKAVGQEVMRSLSPGQAFIKIVQSELEAVMGAAEPLELSGKPRR